MTLDATDLPYPCSECQRPVHDGNAMQHGEHCRPRKCARCGGAVMEDDVDGWVAGKCFACRHGGLVAIGGKCWVAFP